MAPKFRFLTDDIEWIHLTGEPELDYAISPGGDVHMERGGPEGALVFFSFQSPSGHLFDLLDRDQNVIARTTIEELAAGQLAV